MGRSINEVALSLGIKRGTLGNWVKAARDARDRDACPVGLDESERTELQRLRREVIEQPDQLSAGVVFDHAGQSGHQRRHLQAVSLHGDDELFVRHPCTVAPAGSVPHPAVA